MSTSLSGLGLPFFAYTSETYLAILLKNNYLFIYYLFLVVLALHCCAASGGYSLLRCLAFLFGGFSCCRAQAVGAWASIVVAHGL